ncbi:MAG: signal peptidase I [Clostridiales Family XIII bacterium]|jgi:signal peptidase I|nr:signal peptidase I [Clostridiales Family XIII bacterium]
MNTGAEMAMNTGAEMAMNTSLAKERGAARPSALRDLLSLLLKIGVIAGVAILMFTFVYGLHRNADPGMNPAVKDGDLAVFYRFDKDYAAGDLLVLAFRGERQVRRVVAVAGDTVDITEEGLMVNGARQQEPEIYEATQRYADGPAFPMTLSAGRVFVLGDSREDATDSRVYGPVNADDTLGSVIALIRRRNM